MHRLPHSSQRLLAWFVCVTLLLAAFAPTASRAMAASGPHGAEWSEVCTAAGTVWISLRDGSTATQERPDEHATGEHGNCPWCSLQSDTLAVLPTAVPSLPAPLLPALLPRLFLDAPRPLFVWTAARPRGPPVLA